MKFMIIAALAVIVPASAMAQSSSFPPKYQQLRNGAGNGDRRPYAHEIVRDCSAMPASRSCIVGADPDPHVRDMILRDRIGGDE